MPAFESLGEDVGLLILSFCDIATVLSLGLVCLALRPRRFADELQVNISIRQLTMRKQLWILLVEDLVSKALVDLPHTRSLQDHSVKDLIALVKRTVLGPATWSKDMTPIVAEEISLPESFIAAESLQLLPGGRYVFVVRGGSWHRFELWNVHAHTALWTSAVGASALRAIEMSDGGRSVVICFGLRHSVTVIQVDLDTGETHDLFDAQLPEACILQGGVTAISGDFLAFAAYWHTDPTRQTYAATYAILLINWRAEKYVFIWHPRPISFQAFVPAVTFAPGHIIFTMTHDEIFVYATASFKSRWRRVSSMNFDNIVDCRLKDLVPAVIARLKDFPVDGPVDKLWIPTLMVYCSPLRHDSYKLLVYHSGTIHIKATHGDPYFRVMLNYGFSIAHETGALERWERTSAIRAGRTVYRGGAAISYAGYCVESARNIVALHRPAPRQEHETASVVFTMNKGFRASLSGYSHACVHLRDSRLVLSYYV
ncbi:hypothetical protein DFH06DRAFT_572837 [Mycena polygramma]|nr:hypothetical protein DFH06DRAFT_572837 [Mycena polygramma]